MNSKMKSSLLRIVLVSLTLVALVTGMALPAFAAPPVFSNHAIQGTVTAIGTDGASFTVQNGNQTPEIVKVDANTRFLVVPLGKVNSIGNQQKNSDKNDNRGNDKNNSKNNRMPDNWRGNLGWVDNLQTHGKFSDLQVGDRVIVQGSGDGIARQVLIVKAPAIQTVKGTISAISAGSITITPTTGTAITLTSNADTHLTLKGAFLPQVGQKVTAVYNRNTLIAQTITIQSGAVTPPPVNATLTSVAVSPAAPAVLSVGAAQQFTATGYYSNSTQADITSQVTWLDSNTTVASITTAGLATGLTAGATLISASFSGITSAAVTLTVAAVPVATLTSITVTPATANIATGLTQQFNAVAAYSNGTSLNVNSVATWASSNVTVAAVSNSGLATGAAAGTTVITASLSGLTSAGVTLTVVTPTLTSITVTPATASVLVGLTQQYDAVAAYSNGTTQNVNSTVTWASSNTTVATVSNTGLATGASAGTTVITASLSGITSTGVTLTVNTPTLTSITVTPGTPVSLHIGAAQQFAATAAYNNGNNVNVTTQVTWASSNVTAASITAAGLTTGLAAGTTSVTAAMSGLTSVPVAVTIIP